MYLTVVYNRAKNEKNPCSGFGEKFKKHHFLTLVLDYLRTMNFFQKLGPVTFLHVCYLTFMQNFRKILRTAFEEIYNGRMDGQTNMGYY